MIEQFLPRHIKSHETPTDMLNRIIGKYQLYPPPNRITKNNCIVEKYKIKTTWLKKLMWPTDCKRPPKRNDPVVVLCFRDNYYLLDGSRRIKYALETGIDYMESYFIKLKNVKFSGVNALNYENRRSHKAEWQMEQSIIDSWLSNFQGVRLLDIPIGTGRYIPLYQKYEIEAVGIDLSEDMLEIARQKSALDLRVGNVMNIEFPDKYFDVTVCTRLVNWLSPTDMEKAINEMLRVSQNVFLSIRFGKRKYKANSPHVRNTFPFIPLKEESIDDNDYVMVHLV